jgi:hypothetical protein
MLADASVFVGLTSMPIGHEVEFLDEMDRFFGNYRSAVSERLLPAAARAGFEEHLYRPVPYVLLGPFDVAFFSLVDDHDFAVQKFHEFNPLWIRHVADGALASLPLRGFAHRAIVGPCPRWSEDEVTTLLGQDEAAAQQGLYERRIVKLAQETFLRKSPLPLVGICQVEVNNSFLIGGGGNFMRCLVKAIESRFHELYRENGKTQGPIHLIAMEGYSWHELTLLVFGTSFKEIDDFVSAVRTMDLLDVARGLYRERYKGPGKTVPDQDTRDSYRREWVALRAMTSVYGSLSGKRPDDMPKQTWDDIRSYLSAPVHDLQPADVKGRWPRETDLIEACRQVKPYATHVFFNTTTTLGYWAGFVRAVLDHLPKDAAIADVHVKAAREVLDQMLRKRNGDAVPSSEDVLFVIRRWIAKAGHDLGAIAALNGAETNRYALTPGKEDFVFPCDDAVAAVRGRHVPATAFGHMSSADIVRMIGEQMLNLVQWRCRNRQYGEQAAGLLAVRTTVGIPTAESAHEADGLSPGHATADSARTNKAVGWAEIRRVGRDLTLLRVPKVVAARVQNAIALYNDGIRDNFLFSSFVELRRYIRGIVQYVGARAGDWRKGHWDRDQSRDVAQTLNQMVDNFEIGWRNRFHGGWRLSDLSEFTLEFQGGIQQLSSTFHGAYQRLSWYFTGDMAVLATVTGEPGISTFGGAARLNLFDIFKPEFFATHAGHEAAESLLQFAEAELPGVRKGLHYPTDQRALDIVWSLRGRTLGEYDPRTREPRALERVRSVLNQLGGLLTKEKWDIARFAGLPAADSDRLLRRLFADTRAFVEVLDYQKRLAEATESLCLAMTRVHTVAELNSWQPAERQQFLRKLYQAAIECERLGPRRVAQLRLPGSLGRFEGDAPLLEEFLDPANKDPKFFDQVYADLCNYYTVFLRNKELYSYWMLGSFVVDPANWQSPEAVHEYQLREVLLRMFLVLNSDLSDTRIPRSPDHVLEPVRRFWGQLDAHGADPKVIRRMFDLSEKVRLSCASIGDVGWLQEFAHLARCGLQTKRLVKQRAAVEDARLLGEAVPWNRGYDWLDQELLRKNDVFGGKSRLEEASARLASGMAFVGGRMREWLERYKWPSGKYPVEADRWFDFCDTVAVMHAYLQLLKEASLAGNPNAVIVLKRDPNDGTASVKGDEGYAKLLFDPRGGTFTYDPVLRRKYLMWRSALVMSLHDISEKAKLVECERG